MGMTIDEAIEILEKEEEDTWLGPEDKWKSAVKMGYEALKAVSNYRLCGPLDLFKKLPGETKE